MRRPHCARPPPPQFPRLRYSEYVHTLIYMLLRVIRVPHILSAPCGFSVFLSVTFHLTPLVYFLVWYAEQRSIVDSAPTHASMLSPRPPLYRALTYQICSRYHRHYTQRVSKMQRSKQIYHGVWCIQARPVVTFSLCFSDTCRAQNKQYRSTSNQQ